MRIGEVIGKLTLSKCDARLCGGRFLIVQPHGPESLRSMAFQAMTRPKGFQAVEGSENPSAHGQDAHATDHGQDARSTGRGQDARATAGEIEVVYDGVGARQGDRVGFSEGRTAAMPFHPDKVAIDAYLACILDQVSYE